MQSKLPNGCPRRFTWCFSFLGIVRWLPIVLRPHENLERNLQRSVKTSGDVSLISLTISFHLYKATFPPHIYGPQVINATINETVEVLITASHNYSSSFVFSVKYFPNIEIVTNTSQNLVIRWRPMSTQKVGSEFPLE